MKPIILTKADVSFEVNGQPVKFTVIHNLKKMPGLSFDDALTNWLARTKSFTADSLCKYIASKDESVVIMTVTQFNRLNR